MCLFGSFYMYQGIVRAIKDYQDPLKEHEVTIFVRRGGPNYQEGLRVMGEVGEFVHVRIVYKKNQTHVSIKSNSVLKLMLISFVCAQERPLVSPFMFLALRPT